MESEEELAKPKGNTEAEVELLDGERSWLMAKGLLAGEQELADGEKQLIASEMN